MSKYLNDETITNAERDNMAVDEFANAMKEKLEKARAKGRYGWHSKLHCSDEHLAHLFHEHLSKCNDGNFIDLANFLMFLHVRGAKSIVLSNEAQEAKSCKGCIYDYEGKNFECFVGGCIRIGSKYSEDLFKLNELK